MSIELKDFSHGFRDVAEVIGIEDAILLAKKLGGMAFYVPKLDSLERATRDRSIRSEFDGSNYSVLAKKYNLTVSWIREIVHTKEKV